MIFQCACGATPDVRETQRIRDDLGCNPSVEEPAGWHCPTCAPDLQQAASGLFWDILEVGGSSPEHEYKS